MRPRTLLLLLALALPAAADLTPAELDAKLAEGRDQAARGLKWEAFQTFEAVIRGSEDQAHKFAARDEMLKLGPIAARKQNDEEQALVERRILDEKHRYYGDVMDRLAGKGLLRGVMLFRKKMWEDNGSGKEDRQVQAMRDLAARILREVPKEDMEEVEKLKKTVKKEMWVKAAEAKEAAGKKHLALELYKDAFHFAGIVDEKEVEKLRAKIEELEKAVLEAVTPEEQQEFDDAVNHRAWGDLVTRESHHFVFIGDRLFVPRIPEQSILLLDIGYIFITDMIERAPDDDGQRITIFFKELWNFGGGVGGGKTIDIGSVDIRAKNISVSNGLYYHELSHCLFDTAMIYGGFTEGVANFGATMALMCVGLTQEGEGSFRSNLEAFKRDFLGRDMMFFRTQPYGPTCGFWLYFLDKYGRMDQGLDWSKYRKWFRLWRRHPVPPDKLVEKARVFGRCLAQVFGPGIWDDLKSFGFPVGPEDDERTRLEEEKIAKDWQIAQNRWDRGDAEGAFESCQELAKKWPDHHLAAMARRLSLFCLDKMGGSGGMDAIRKELGIVMEWKVIGPFYSTSNTALHDVHPPEWEIDYAKEYVDPHAKAKWFDPKIRFDGVVTFEFAYMDGIACYGLVNAKVPQDTDAWLYVGSDDGWAAWVNGELVEKHPNDRGYTFDEDRHDIRLRAGWNRALVKIRNGGGGMGFGARITDRKGRAIDGLELSGKPQEVPWMQTGKKPGKADVVWKDDFLAKGTPGRYGVPCGGWTIVKPGVMYGTDDKHNMQWQKFLVTPGKEKDSPAQCAWIKDSTFKGAKDLAIDLKLAMTSESRPKFSVTLDGEGQNDGLSGITLIFLPNGEGCSVRLEHYDRFVYHNPQVVFPAAKSHDVRIIRFQGRLTVTIDGQSAFDDISMPPVKTSNFLGIATWNKSVGLDELTVYRLGEK
ncbi:MAG: hypothetical protein HYY18_11585 [Planctomycetes bacterium]|nr:hypothetical protein [Planctomycetota bacterium]